MSEHAAGPGKVAVVGGSAAGFFTAYLLARGGQPVEVYEQARPLNPEARTLIVTDHLRELLGPLSGEAIVNRIHRFELFADGRVAEVPLNRPDLIIERAALIRSLAAQAEAAGVQVRLGQRFVDLTGSGGGLRLTIEGQGSRKQVHAGTVVGADGAASRVARAAGWSPQPTVPLIQAIVRLPRDVPAHTVRVWFVPEDTPYFYWLIPESPERAALGLIGEQGPETQRRLERFLERQRLEPLAFQAARIPLYTGWVDVERHLGGGRVYLVGDAAGQVKVTTVGGVVTGFRGAVGVAEAILNGGSSRELGRLRRELTLHLLVRRALHGFSQQDYCRLLDSLNGSIRGSLSVYTRDEAGHLLWNLCRQQPRLLLWGLRALLAGGRFPGTSRPSAGQAEKTEPGEGNGFPAR